MPKRIVTEAEAFPVSDSAEQEAIEAFDEQVQELDESLDVEVLRIEEVVGLSWRGVSGCQSRVNAEAKAKLESWVKDKIFQYRDLKMLRYGNGQGQVRCGSGGGGWPDNGRWCGCSGSMPCYIEFLKR